MFVRLPAVLAVLVALCGLAPSPAPAKVFSPTVYTLGNGMTVVVTATDREAAEAKEKLTGFVKFFNVEAIAIGNGTAGRETEAFVRALAAAAGLVVSRADLDVTGEDFTLGHPALKARRVGWSVEAHEFLLA